MQYFLGVESAFGLLNVFSSKLEEVASFADDETSLIVDTFDKRREIIKIGSVPITIDRDFSTSSLALSKARLRLFLRQFSCLNDECSGTDVLILGMPKEMSTEDFFSFLSISAKNIEKIVFLRDALETFRLMVALRFTSKTFAEKFLTEFNGIQFMEKRPEFCQIVPLEQRGEDSSSLAEYVELPNCPLCIGRLDASVTGIPSSKCDHESEVCMCFSKWKRNNNCKICSILLMGNNERLSCSECFASKDSLWLCLVCGFLGCGRYDQGHARKHYESNPSHRFAIDTEFQRIWDYSSDKYVHRVIHFVSQNRIVDFPGPCVPSEFSHEFYSECKEKQEVPTNSCPLQPQIHNARQARELDKAIEQLEQLQIRTTKAESALEAKEHDFYAQCIKIESLKKENEIMHCQITALRRELEGERALSTALSTQIHQINQEKQELEEQNKDLLAHFEMIQKINEETAQGDLKLVAVKPHQQHTRKPKTRPKK